MLINYDELLAEYNKNLNENLRGFTGGPPPFEDWVPTEGDDAKSVRDLVNLAYESGHEVVTVINKGLHEYYKRPGVDDLEEAINVIACKHWQQLVRIVGLKRNVLTLDYKDIPGKEPFHLHLIKLESYLEEATGRRYNIETLNVDDQNKREIKRVGRGYENN